MVKVYLRIVREVELKTLAKALKVPEYTPLVRLRIDDTEVAKVPVWLYSTIWFTG